MTNTLHTRSTQYLHPLPPLRHTMSEPKTSINRTLNMELLHAECQRRGLKLGLDSVSLHVSDERGLVDDVLLRRRGWSIPVEIAASMLLASLNRP